MKSTCRLLILLIALAYNGSFCHAQDTLRIMTYNVLHYGDGCQGSNASLHANLKTIVKYENPDVFGMVKAQVIKLNTNDFVGISSVGFADSILIYGFNAAYPNKYDHCPVVNFSNDPDADMDLLFYNKHKLSFLSVTNLCELNEDFNLYKLFYKDPNLSLTGDTTFLYVVLNHTASGSNSTERDVQDSLVFSSLKKRFTHLPNLISMGDFNTHSSLEPGYQLLTSSADSSFSFFDPPYFPDSNVRYPSNWDANAGAFSAYLNTSTREKDLPNACGSANGAKGWYLHILLSPWVIKNKNYVKYIPNSYRTIGNDGRRVGVSINDSVKVVKNTSVPPLELNALYSLSDKYPIMVSLLVTKNTTGISPADPDSVVITEVQQDNETLTCSNPIENTTTFYFSPTMVGKKAAMQWNDLLGKSLRKEDVTINDEMMTLRIDLTPGIYLLWINVDGTPYAKRVLKL